MKFLIGADIVPTKTNQAIFESGQIEEIVDVGLLEILNDADYRIFNLECPLTDKHSPIEKCGPNLIASTASVNGIKVLGVDFVTIANNHIMDQGDQGLYSTIKVLQEANIAFAGVGDNLKEVWKPFIVTLGDKRVGIYCCAEHEFSIAEKDKPGANPFDPLHSPDHISELRGKCDYLICLYHGGKEHYRYPAPYLQKVCRKIVEKGADLVVCQHSHCVGCKEEYCGGTIVYGQGNFLFDNSDSDFWQTSLLISVELDTKKISYYPLQKVKTGSNSRKDRTRRKLSKIFTSVQMRYCRVDS